MGGKDGSLNVDIKPEQAKALCDEFKSASKKCRTHAVVGKMLGGNCGGAGKDGKDFCDGAPTHLVNLCKAEKLKCKTTSKEEAKQKACWEKKMKELKDMANRGSGSGAKKPQGSGSGSTGGSGSSICSIALTTMRDMMKGIDMKKEITKERLKGLCLGYSSMGQMAAQLANCKNDELRKGLANAKKLCPPKQTGSGSGAKKPMTTKKADASQMCAEALKKLSGFRTIQDVKKVSVFKKAALCSVYSQVSTIKRAALKQMCSKSTELKQALAVADALCGAKKPMATKKPGSTGSGSGKDAGKDGKDAFVAALGDCPVLRKFYEANKGKDGSLNVDIKPEQAKALCDEFKSASKKCRTHAVVGKMLGGNCGGAGKDGKDFCDEAPPQLVKLCKAEQLKCKNYSKEEAKQKACWEKKWGSSRLWRIVDQ